MRQAWADPHFDVRRCLAAFVAGLGVFGVAASFGLAVGGSKLESQSAVWCVDSPRVVVLKSARSLLLFDGDSLVRTYPVDLGTAPIGQKRVAGDGRTPEGHFRIVTKNADSPYHRFLGISFPDPEAVVVGLRDGLLSSGDALSLLDAANEGRRPDWRSAMGGGIGLHGHRRGTDWTGGCVALADEHIEELFSVLRIGDSVEILP